MLFPANRSNKFFLLSIALLGWFALVAQFHINITSGVATSAELLIRYFSYFTILTNLLVALCCTWVAVSPQRRWGAFFSKTQTLTAITVYILVVGIVYNIILRFLWQPKGLQKLVDELLHSVIPILFLLYWLLFVNKQTLQWKQIFSWLAYPLVYLLFILVRGSFSGFYPYPFVNVDDLGMNKVLLNSVAITALFIITGLLLIAAGKWQYRRHNEESEV